MVSFKKHLRIESMRRTCRVGVRHCADKTRDFVGCPSPDRGCGSRDLRVRDVRQNLRVCKSFVNGSLEINEFKRFYRSVDALLIDDIQFFAQGQPALLGLRHLLLLGFHVPPQLGHLCARQGREHLGL